MVWEIRELVYSELNNDVDAITAEFSRETPVSETKKRKKLKMQVCRIL
jgi:hypothetical protein